MFVSHIRSGNLKHMQSSSDCWVGRVAFLYACRRLFIEELAIKGIITNWRDGQDRADAVYLPLALQRPLNKRIETLFEEYHTEDLNTYASYMSPDRYDRTKRSTYNSWKAHLFGKDWFFNLFLAFGTVTPCLLYTSDAADE